MHRHFTAPAGSFFLLGPHGSGKSCWARRTFPHALVVDLEDSALERRLRARPEQLEGMLGPRPRQEPVIIDGVDKVPELVDVVRRVNARKKGWRFILIGSSARAVKRDRISLLSRRFPRVFMHPFVAAEMGRRFHVSDAMRLGTVPAIIDDPRPAQARADYYEYFFRREVKNEKLVPNFDRFRKFLQVIGSAHAAQLDVAALARACELDRKLVAGYVDVLEQQFLVTRLEPFTRRARRALFTQPKCYVFDAGVYRAMPADPEQAAEDVEMAALEGLVFQHLRAWASWAPKAERTMGFWRTRTGHQMPFVIQSRDEFVAIAVKNAFAVTDDDIDEARAFLVDYPQAKVIVLHRGPERTERKRILCLPVDEFLPRLHPSRSVSVAARQGERHVETGGDVPEARELYGPPGTGVSLDVVVSDAGTGRIA